MRSHAKKLMYAGLLLLYAALWVFRPSLPIPNHVVDAQGSVDKKIRNDTLIASHPTSVQRGDIVVYNVDQKTFARRLIGLPGDIISVEDGGIFIGKDPIDKNPIDTTFLEKGAPILPLYNNYRVPPNRIVVGTGATQPGKFWLIEIDKPAELRYGEVVYSAAGAISRATFLAILAGVGYVLLLAFGPLIAERYFDPGERHYGVLKFVWYAVCTVWFLALLLPFFIALNDWNFSAWQNAQVILLVINLELTSLLGYLGATLKQSAIVSFIIGLSGIASATAWVSKFWRQVQFKAVDTTATPGTDSSKQLPEKRSPRRRANRAKPA